LGWWSIQHTTLHRLLSAALAVILYAPVVCWAFQVGPFKKHPRS
jgi:hypothetical protein